MLEIYQWLIDFTINISNGNPIVGYAILSFALCIFFGLSIFLIICLAAFCVFVYASKLVYRYFDNTSSDVELNCERDIALYNKCYKMILGCKTIEQYNVCRNYLLAAYSSKKMSFLDVEDLDNLCCKKMIEISNYNDANRVKSA